MPANLPPQYIEAEKTFRAAKTAEEKIMALEEMLRSCQAQAPTTLRQSCGAHRQTHRVGGQKVGRRRASMLIDKEGRDRYPWWAPNAGKSQLVST